MHQGTEVIAQKDCVRVCKAKTRIEKPNFHHVWLQFVEAPACLFDRLRVELGEWIRRSLSPVLPANSLNTPKTFRSRSQFHETRQTWLSVTSP